ncbi:MAG: non-heme iron oxygenase ferredoxin subunit [Pseudomonadota bacterium]
MTRTPVWTDLIAAAMLEPSDVTPVTMGGRRLAVYDAPDGVHVTAALCTHGGADLCDGYFDGRMIECPLHQGAFDIRDGRPLGPPATRALRVYEARVRDGMVQALL